MSYTKGKWYVDGYKYATIQSKNMNEKIVVTYPTIATVNSTFIDVKEFKVTYPTIATVNSTFIDVKEFKANAKLISKAPELLEFIQKYYKYLNLDDQEKAKNLIDSCGA